MLNDVSTGFVGRLRARDPQAWFELWETFGPILRAQLRKWGRGRIGAETVQDLSQETLAALSQAIDTHDPSKGARFSTWLLAIARYTLGDEIDRRMALKRGSGVRPASLDETWQGVDRHDRPDASYEQAVFDAKVDAALRSVEREFDLVLDVLDVESAAIGDASGQCQLDLPGEFADDFMDAARCGRVAALDSQERLGHRDRDFFTIVRGHFAVSAYHPEPAGCREGYICVVRCC